VLLRRAIVAGETGVGSWRLWPSWLRLLGRTCLRRCAPTRKRQSSVRCLCNMPWAGSHSERGASPRIACIVSRGLAPLAGKGRASAGAATGDGCSTSVERPKPLGSGSRRWLAIGERRERKLEASPVSTSARQGVSTAGRVRDCVVRARVLIVKTDSRGAHASQQGAPSSELRQRRSELCGRSAPRGGDRSSAEGEERFGARWNGLVNEALVGPPVRHHGPGTTNADAGCSQHPCFRWFTSPPPERARATSLARPKRPRSPRSANLCAARCFGRGSALPPSGGGEGASRLARKHVSFRRLQ
jgi:hypothetical protein